MKKAALNELTLNKAYVLGEYHLRPRSRGLSRNGTPVHITAKPFQVLVYLIENRDRFASRAELLDRFWEGHDVYDVALSKCIGAIRKALDDRSDRPQYIATRWAEGYRYIGPFEERTDAGDSPSVEIERIRAVK